MKLVEQYRRFRAWQKKPTRYTNRNADRHRCANCGHEFEGNYCPICRQEAGDGRITWRWVRTSIMNLWGMDSRSMPYSLFQLLLRPGYFIGDFISGHRQASYPPVSMLFGMAVIFAIVKQLFSVPHPRTIEVQEGMEILSAITIWLKTNPGWGAMTITCLFTIPTWFFFRFSPRYTRHTFPESIFIQLFMSSLMLICTLFARLSPAFSLLIPFYYYITYRQLFGYRPWGTLWRLGLCTVVWGFAILCISSSIVMLTPGNFIIEEDYGASSGVILFLVLFVPQLIILAFGYGVGKRAEKKRIKKT